YAPHGSSFALRPPHLRVCSSLNELGTSHLPERGEDVATLTPDACPSACDGSRRPRFERARREVRPECGSRHSRVGLLPGDGAGATRQHPARTGEVTRVSVRVTLEIVLMLGLGLPERPRRRHLGDHLAGPETRGLDVGDRVLGDTTLLVVEVEDRGAIAQSDVVALAVERRRVVDLEEELQQLAIRGLL